MLGGWELGVGSCRAQRHERLAFIVVEEGPGCRYCRRWLPSGQRARSYTALARRGPASLRRDRRVRSAAGDGLLARAHPFRDVLLPSPGIVVITSENFDGEWIARIIERFGYGTARGSTTRGGLKAMHQLVRDMREGRPAGFTLDGPRGPARVAQPGAVWLAAHTGNPLLPFHLEASSYWSVRSWDRTQIPKPFSTVALVVGEPIEVAKGSKNDALEVVRADLERRLVSLEQRAHALLVT